MHETALEIGERFFTTYLPKVENARIVDIGSLNVNGSLRDVIHDQFCEYVGVDFCEGKGVDVILEDPYHLPFPSNSIDICVSSSCFEHSEFFWLLFLEVQRILKPSGLLYVNAPSNGAFHRYPVDCWRFYPDSGLALMNWGRRNSFETILLESFVSLQRESGWNDFVAVFLKNSSHAAQFPERILSSYTHFQNGRVHEDLSRVMNLQRSSEDQLLQADRIDRFISNLRRKSRSLLHIITNALRAK